MNSRDFVYWLQGFFELHDHPDPQLNAAQTAMVKRHLAMVFKHEIDPGYGDKKTQAMLDALHKAKDEISQRPEHVPVAHDHIHPDQVLYRC